MGFFSKAWDNIQEKFRENSERKRLDKLQMDGLRKEAKFHHQVAFEEAYRENSRLVAIARAKKEAAKSSGYQKLKATERLNRLKQSDANEPMNLFAKIRDHTQKNLARRDENLKRTEERMKIAAEMRQKKLADQQSLRASRLDNNKFGGGLNRKW